MRHYGKLLVIAMLPVMLMLAGCFGGTSKPVKFYMLGSDAAVGQPLSSRSAKSAPSLMIGPITMAEYLNRDKIVIRDGDSGLIVKEFSRWAEPLKDAFYRLLVQDLSTRLDTSLVYAYGSNSNASTRYQVVIDVTRFDSDTQGNTLLVAFWTIYGKDGRKVLANNKTVLKKQADSAEMAAMVAAQNQMLTDLGERIANMVRKLEK